MIELVDVAKSFGSTQVLKPTTLRLEPGRTTVLIGPSGCGKSTILRLMIGLIEPDQGEVLFDGHGQGVGMLGALMLDPAVILLDEPMGALDPLVRFDLQEDLRKIFQTLGKTVAMVTHDMGEAGFFGDRVILLGAGRIVQEGTLEDLLRAPADEFVERFISAQRLPATTNGASL